MYRRILVPLDGSVLAESILPQVEDLARRFDSQVILVRAAIERALPGWAHTLAGLDEAELKLQAVREAEEYLAVVERRLRVRGLAHVEAVVWYSEPAEAILEQAARHHVGLIAMSSHGRGGLGRFLAGSVATEVLRSTNVPILLHRPLLTVPNGASAAAYRRILVPLDGTELAETILPHVVTLAKATEAEIVLLKVTPPEPAFYRMVTGGGDVSVMLREVPAGLLADEARRMYYVDPEREHQQAADYLQHVQSHVASHGVAARTVIRSGLVAEEIIAAVREEAADMVAMATHGRSTIGRLLRGSVSDEVARSTAVPVLLTRSARVPAAQKAVARKAS